MIIWKNLAYQNSDELKTPEQKLVCKRSNSTITKEIVSRNARKGESDDSETDSEDEGYDSDVRREHVIDYNKNIFVNDIIRPTVETVQNMFNKVTVSNKMYALNMRKFYG